MLLSVHRTRSHRMEFCVHGGLGDTLNKQRRKLNGYPGALLARIIFMLGKADLGALTILSKYNESSPFLWVNNNKTKLKNPANYAIL